MKEGLRGRMKEGGRKGERKEGRGGNLTILNTDIFLVIIITGTYHRCL